MTDTTTTQTRLSVEAALARVGYAILASGIDAETWLDRADNDIDYTDERRTVARIGNDHGINTGELITEARRVIRQVGVLPGRPSWLGTAESYARFQDDHRRRAVEHHTARAAARRSMQADHLAAAESVPLRAERPAGDHRLSREYHVGMADLSRRRAEMHEGYLDRLTGEDDFDPNVPDPDDPALPDLYLDDDRFATAAPEGR